MVDFQQIEEHVTQTRRANLRALMAGVAGLGAGAAVLAPRLASTAFAAPKTGSPTLPVTGTGAAGTFLGNFTIDRFVASGGALNAVGTLTGAFTPVGGTAQQIGQQAVTLPVILPQSSGSCQILHLVLGPLDLDLLGLKVHLDQVVLDITAQSGPGNLLCAIAALLDSNGALASLAQLLNQLLGALG